ncbi:MAG TPA: MBL fold metallo-hydrolase [Baekduia sp.]|uniref:MBL fold metallo-hydrolase n=1 Tax=Baekduia sp. TaxID=2600305 RepID=UPI002D78FE73|nr:MBL fold metallo-hydrolase [Baekduia sp.]HET6510035.1 MBL fold metallo-hydrolase [Baekduia sp.]
MNELARGLYRWAARHPEWHPGAHAGDFGAEVGSYAALAGDELLLIDPLVAEDDTSTLEALDTLHGAATDTSILITIGYHARSAEALAARYGATVFGPPQVARRLERARFAPLEPGGAPGPAGVVAHAIGKPRRGETPLWLPSHRALAFGDALVVTPAGELRMWAQDQDEPKRRAFYRERFAPTLAPLAALEPAHVLVTHGEPVLGDGARALRAAIAADPWFRAG